AHTERRQSEALRNRPSYSEVPMGLDERGERLRVAALQVGLVDDGRHPGCEYRPHLVPGPTVACWIVRTAEEDCLRAGRDGLPNRRDVEPPARGEGGEHRPAPVET